MIARAELFERAATAMVVLDASLDVVDANPAAARLFGDRPLEDCMRPEDAALLRSMLEAGDEAAIEIRVRTSRGELRVDVDAVQLEDGSWLLSLHVPHGARQAIDRLPTDRAALALWLAEMPRSRTHRRTGRAARRLGAPRAA